MVAAEAHRLGVLEEVHADPELVRIGLIGTEKIRVEDFNSEKEKC